jgi:hypothetical protein
MVLRTLLVLLLIAGSTAAVRAQYSKPRVPQSEEPARSQNTCPWLAQGSASRVLGGEVLETVSVSDTDEGSCRFLRRQSPLGDLKVVVSKTVVASCPAGSTELKGIGNRAARCNAPGSHSGGVAMISGRVRDLHFAVTLSTPGQKKPVKMPDVQEDALEQIAEQIAGNLY